MRKKGEPGRGKKTRKYGRAKRRPWRSGVNRASRTLRNKARRAAARARQSAKRAPLNAAKRAARLRAYVERRRAQALPVRLNHITYLPGDDLPLAYRRAQ